MKTTAFLLSTLLLLTGTAALTAQDTGKVGIQQLIEQLGDTDYEVRKSAEKRLLERGRKALGPLQKSAKKHDDPEVQWRAGRLARRIEDRSAGKVSRRLGKRDGSRDRKAVGGDERKAGEAADPSRVIERVMRDLDRALLGREFDDGVRHDLERAMEQMRSSLRKSLGDLELDERPRGFRTRRSDSHSMKMSSGPDGVRVEITEKGEDGKLETKVYEAEDMESFRKKHPGVLKNSGVQVGGALGEDFPFGFRGRVVMPRIPRDGGRFRFEFDDAGGQWGENRKSGKKSLRRKPARVETEVAESERKRLGFYVGEISPAVREYLNLQGGLMVKDVADGSIAAKIGLRQGDIVTRVGEKKIQDVDDVAAALEAIGDGKVVVTIIRRGRELKLD